MSDKKDNVIRLVVTSKPEGCAETLAAAAQVDWAAIVISGWVVAENGLIEHVVWKADNYQDALWLMERAKQTIMAEHDHQQETEDE